ncbi:LamG-like jellyroll fold domain-containing protein [Aquimarina sp. MMG016]|uniref:LamG-like jellyroll fold domain-containing protein n=1 Tax=Aquimarina sp. MMG016 TaxID=2822690 RepID=UPI001B3A632F|nr:LamG-like jellyroll fold domain-containing protein [Aquimarina sp. MMG016]MBQ4822217.1 T9SS type A sorting domain-containing protein [Aquimarina sp. MMG016]
MNKKIHWTLIIAFVFNYSILLGQNDVIVVSPKYPKLFKSIPTLTSDSPEWVELMYSENPNVEKIALAYERYYHDKPLVKNVHTQNYKHFMRMVYSNQYVKEDGSIYIPSVTEEKILKKANAPKKSRIKNNKLVANWTRMGPFDTYQSTGSRKQSRHSNIYAIDQSQSNTNVLIAGTETGTVYFSTDKAESWTLTANELLFGSRGIGAVAIDPNSDQIFYIANSNSLYKSTNQGGSWSEIHNISGLRITDISINPDNSQEIITAGGLGLYKSIDGGSTWSHILSGERCWDIERKTDDNNTIFVARTNSTKNIVEIWKSIDSGTSFAAKTSGWYSPTGDVAVSAGGARIGVTIADPNRLYVLLLGNDDSYAEDVNFQGIYMSSDAGETWVLPYDGDGDGNADNDPGGPYNATDDWCMSCFGIGGGNYDQGFYNAAIDVSDTDPDRFLVGLLNLFKSEDGAKTFTRWGGYQCDGCGDHYRHPDIQEIEINGNDVWVASDGGLDLYDPNFDYIDSKMTGIDGTEYWGFGQGWNEDIVVGGRYHNGNAVYKPNYANGRFIALGGGEAPTGYMNPANNIASFSDISDKVIPENFTDPVTNAIVNVSKYPNQEIYSLAKRSEVVSDPRYANTQYLGRDNKLWKTVDGGATYNMIYEFGTDIEHKVTDIEIPRANPDYIYVVQYLPSSATKLWKSVDGGATWTELAGPGSNSYVELQVATDDENEVYVSYGNDWSNGNKVFKSIDGGVSWTNLTTSTLDRSVRHLIIQDGTEGGVYAVTYRDVYYRNDSMTDWIEFGDGLPGRRNFNKLIPFYRDGKIRAATYNYGMLESNLYEDSKPIAQPITLNKKYYCSRDDIQFEDFSVLKHQGASWLWSFPGASYVSDATIRNPIVRYDIPGTYDVTLTVTDVGGNSDTKTVVNMIEFEEDLCTTAVADIGNAMYTTSTNNFNDEYLQGEDFGLDNVTHFTMTAWIKPDDVTQQGAAAIFSSKDNTNGGNIALNIRTSNELQIHYKGSQWQWNPGLFVNPGEWNYVAMVTTPTEITLYVNEQKAAKSNSNSNPFNMDNYYVGNHAGLWYRVFRGFIDELKVWDRALTEDEIRLQRHLIQTDMSDPNLRAYWQFNQLIDGSKIYDKKSSRDLILRRTPEFLGSTAPVGIGTSAKMEVNSSGVKDFAGAGVSIDFASGTVPNGEVVVTKLNAAPDTNPITTVISDTYWVINNYGTNTTFDVLNNIEFTGVGDISSITDPSELKLFKRNSNDDTSGTWSAGEVASGTAFDIGAQSVTYSNPDITSFSQFFNGIGQILSTDEVEVQDEKFELYPNPIVNGNALRFSNIDEGFIFTLFDISGKEVRKMRVASDQTIIQGLRSGIYIFNIETSTKMYSGELVIQ